MKLTSNSWFVIIVVFALLTSCQRKREFMRISSWVSSPAETELFETTLDSFKVAYPEVPFNFEPIPGNYAEKIQLMLGTQTGPDLFFIKGFLAPSYMSFGVLEPLDARIQAEVDIDIDDFFPNLLQSFQYDGKQYGLPKDFSPYVLFYNEEMFEEAGLSGPPTTWAELSTYAEQLTSKSIKGVSDQYGLVIEPITEMLMPFVYQNNGEFQKADGTLGITEPAFIEALNFYYSLYKQGVATIPTDVGQGWNGDVFGRRKAAMCLSGGWLIPFLKLNYPDLKWKVAFLPKGKSQATVAFTTAFTIPKASFYKDEAWTMMNYLTGTKGMGIWTKGGIAMPSRRSVAIENGFYQDSTYSVFMESAEFAKTFRVEFSERGFEEIVVAMQDIFYNGRDPKDAMKSIEKRILKYSLKR